MSSIEKSLYEISNVRNVVMLPNIALMRNLKGNLCWFAHLSSIKRPSIEEYELINSYVKATIEKVREPKTLPESLPALLNGTCWRENLEPVNVSRFFSKDRQKRRINPEGIPPKKSKYENFSYTKILSLEMEKLIKLIVPDISKERPTVYGLLEVLVQRVERAFETLPLIYNGSSCLCDYDWINRCTSHLTSIQDFVQCLSTPQNQFEILNGSLIYEGCGYMITHSPHLVNCALISVPNWSISIDFKSLGLCTLFFYIYHGGDFPKNYSLGKEHLEFFLSSEAIKNTLLEICTDSAQYVKTLCGMTKHPSNRLALNQFSKINDIFDLVIVDGDTLSYNIPLIFSHPNTGREIRMAVNENGEVVSKWTNMIHGYNTDVCFGFCRDILNAIPYKNERNQTIILKNVVSHLAEETRVTCNVILSNFAGFIGIYEEDDLSVILGDFDSNYTDGKIVLEEIKETIDTYELEKEFQSYRHVGKCPDTNDDVYFNFQENIFLTKRENRNILLTSLNQCIKTLLSPKLSFMTSIQPNLIDYMRQVGLSWLDLVLNIMEKLKQCEPTFHEWIALHSENVIEAARSYQGNLLEWLNAYFLQFIDQPDHTITFFSGHSNNSLYHLLDNIFVLRHKKKLLCLEVREECVVQHEVYTRLIRDFDIELIKQTALSNKDFFVYALWSRKTNDPLITELIMENWIEIFKDIYNIICPDCSGILIMREERNTCFDLFNSLLKDKIFCLKKPYLHPTKLDVKSYFQSKSNKDISTVKLNDGSYLYSINKNDRADVIMVCVQDCSDMKQIWWTLYDIKVCLRELGIMITPFNESNSLITLLYTDNVESYSHPEVQFFPKVPILNNNNSTKGPSEKFISEWIHRFYVETPTQIYDFICRIAILGFQLGLKRNHLLLDVSSGDKMHLPNTIRNAVLSDKYLPKINYVSSRPHCTLNVHSTDHLSVIFKAIIKH